MAHDIGDVWAPILTVRDADGVLTAATVTLAVTSPSGVVTNPTVTTPSVGSYTANVPLTAQGAWLATWTVSGAVTGVETQYAYVRRLGSNVVAVSEVKDRLNKNLTVDDEEIEDLLDRAIAYYEEVIGPVNGSVTEKHHGGRTSLVLRHPNPAAVTAATYSDGTVIDVADLDLDTDTGILYWGYNTAGYFTAGTRNVSVTYTVQPLPAHHRETIVADVAGYFAATQRGPAGLPGEGFEAPLLAAPVVMFPRIRALAAPSVA